VRLFGRAKVVNSCEKANFFAIFTISQPPIGILTQPSNQVHTNFGTNLCCKIVLRKICVHYPIILADVRKL
jgi:hypothetical protein